MDSVLNILGLAYKARKAVLGEEVLNRISKVRLIFLASDLSEKQLRAFQLADNKTGELATWDLGLLDSELSGLAGLFDMSLFGFIPKKGKEESLMGDKESSDGKGKYITCPRCGKRFLKSEGHPKEGGSFDTAMYAPYENHEEDEPGLPKAWTPDGTEDDGGDW